MTNYRVVSEGMYIIDPEGAQLPGLRKTTIWEGGHFPTLNELREISANQADVETQARLDRLASGEEAEKVLEDLLGEKYYIPSHWPLHVQQQRVGRILGHKTLGTVRTSDLFVDDEEDFELQAYWRDMKRVKTPELKEANRKMLMISLGVAAVGAAEIWYATKGMN